MTKPHTPPGLGSNSSNVFVNPLGPPPPRQVLRVGPRLEHALTRRVEHARGDDLAVRAHHRRPSIFAARMPVIFFHPSSWPRPISSFGSPLCVKTRSVPPPDAVISTVTSDSSPRVASDIQVNSSRRGRAPRR